MPPPLPPPPFHTCILFKMYHLVKPVKAPRAPTEARRASTSRACVSEEEGLQALRRLKLSPRRPPQSE